MEAITSEIEGPLFFFHIFGWHTSEHLHIEPCLNVTEFIVQHFHQFLFIFRNKYSTYTHQHRILPPILLHYYYYSQTLTQKFIRRILISFYGMCVYILSKIYIFFTVYSHATHTFLINNNNS